MGRKYLLGQTLLEAVVAISLVTLILSAIVSAINFSLSNTQYARNKALATKYAQEVVEWLRQQRESLGWSDFYNQATDTQRVYCLNSLASWPVSGSCAGGSVISGTSMTRQATLDGNAGNRDRVSINILITWPQGSRTASVELDTYLTQWL